MSERKAEAYVDEFTLIGQLGLIEGEKVEPSLHLHPYIDSEGTLVVPVIVRRENTSEP